MTIDMMNFRDLVENALAQRIDFPVASSWFINNGANFSQLLESVIKRGGNGGTATEGLLEESDVTDLLLQDILTGTLPAGTWLKQIDLEQRYDFPRPDVRRALDRLTQRRLVQHIPNRGYQVYEVDERRSQEISDIRVILETSVAGLMIGHVTEEATRDLRALARHFDDMSFRGTSLQHYDANLAFHRALHSLPAIRNWWNSFRKSASARFRRRSRSGARARASNNRPANIT